MAFGDTDDDWVWLLGSVKIQRHSRSEKSMTYVLDVQI